MLVVSKSLIDDSLTLGRSSFKPKAGKVPFSNYCLHPLEKGVNLCRCFRKSTYLSGIVAYLHYYYLFSSHKGSQYILFKNLTVKQTYYVYKCRQFMIFCERLASILGYPLRYFFYEFSFSFFLHVVDRHLTAIAPDVKANAQTMPA